MRRTRKLTTAAAISLLSVFLAACSSKPNPAGRSDASVAGRHADAGATALQKKTFGVFTTSLQSRSAVDTQPFEVNVTNGMGALQGAAGEPEMALAPAHHVIVMSITWHAQSNGCGIATSNDQGRSWQVVAHNPADPGPSPGAVTHDCSDPIAAAGPDGTLYVGAGWSDGANDYSIYVSRSTDGGRPGSRPCWRSATTAGN
ncbi:sialidase family protein [Streptomyces mirabilis]|nr:sialidase family protein [Streptomyces mirabilis]